MDADARVIHRHNHWLRLACTQPLSEAFYALVYWLLMYTKDTLLDYKDGPPTAGEPPASIAQIAADASNNQSINATAYIACVFDHLYTVCILASYLTGEGDPRKALPLTKHPNRVTLTPSWDVDANEKLMRPVPPHATELRDMSEQQRDAMTWPQRFRFILATVNRFYHDTANRNGAVLGALFLVLVERVPEIRHKVQTQLNAEGVNDADCATMFNYMADEMRALALSNMDFGSAHSHWNGAWGSVCHTLNNNDFARMTKSVAARARARDEVAERVRESTARKRQSRADKKLKKKQTKSAAAAAAAAIDRGDDDDGQLAEMADADDLVDAMRVVTTAGQSTSDIDHAGRAIGRAADALEDDDDDDDNLSGILFD